MNETPPTDTQTPLPVQITDGITIGELIEQIETARGRKVRIVELEQLGRAGGTLCGLWLCTENEDIILHAPSESDLHREQFILHELAHMILQHDLDERAYAPADLLEGLSVGTVKAMTRGDTDNPFEDAAERLADDLARALRGRATSPFLEVFG